MFDASDATLAHVPAVAGLVDLTALHLVEHPVAPLLRCLFESGEAALISELERLGVPRLAQRHSVAGALATAVLRGELSQAGELPLDYLHYASAKMHPAKLCHSCYYP